MEEPSQHNYHVKSATISSLKNIEHQKFWNKFSEQKLSNTVLNLSWDGTQPIKKLLFVKNLLKLQIYNKYGYLNTM